jgi:hypothetical protein
MALLHCIGVVSEEGDSLSGTPTQNREGDGHTEDFFLRIPGRLAHREGSDLCPSAIQGDVPIQVVISRHIDPSLRPRV